jgi:hypothetical protein
MPLRIPLFMKKRGQRRTGVRWLGPLGEAVLFAVLLLLGADGIAMLMVGAITPPWPWLVGIIPASLLLYGGLGLVELMWHSSTSTELRSAVAKKAADLELRIASGESPHALPAIPSIARVVDSPGVRLAYRLPIDTSPKWMLLGMTLICICWNLLVGMFVYQVIDLHVSGHPNWLLTWLMVPFVLAGLWTLVVLARAIWITTGIGATRLEVSHHPLHAGETFRLLVSQAGRINMRWMKVVIVCQEQATYAQGTDTRTEISRVHRQLLYRRRKFDIKAAEPFAVETEAVIPNASMHSFVSPHNSVDWLLIVSGKAARWAIFERKFPIYVYPTSATSEARQLASDPTIPTNLQPHS